MNEYKNFNELQQNIDYIQTNKRFRVNNKLYAQETIRKCNNANGITTYVYKHINKERCSSRIYIVCLVRYYNLIYIRKIVTKNKEYNYSLSKESILYKVFLRFKKSGKI